MRRSKRPSVVPKVNDAGNARVSSASGAAQAILRAVTAHAVSVYAATEGEHALLLRASAGWHPPPCLSRVEFSPAAPTWKHDAPLLSARPVDDLPEQKTTSHSGTSSYLMDVPIGGGATRGVVRCLRDRAFGAGDAEVVSRAGAWLQALIEAWQSEAAVTGAALHLACCDTEQALIQCVVNEASKLVHAEPDRSGVYLSRIDPDGTTGYVLHSDQHPALKHEYTHSSRTPTGFVLTQGRLLWSAHIKQSLACQSEWSSLGIAADTEEHATHAFIGVPLRVRDQTGALILKARAPQAWGILEVRLVEQLAQTFLAQLDRLRVRESLLFSLFTASHRPIAAVDLEGNVLEVNSAAAKIVQKPEDVLRQTTVDVAFYGGDKLLALHVTDALQASGDEPLRGHYTYLTREASDHVRIPIPVCLEAKQLAVRGGRPVGSVGIFDPLLPDPLPEVARSYGDFDEFTFTADPHLLDLLDEADESRDRSLLLIGERGSGKSFVARHLRTSMSEKFVSIRCGELEAGALADQLGFGKETGRVDEANSGVLFLDELSYVPPMVQRKLLNVLEDGQIGTRPVHVRLIAATRCLPDQLHDGSKFLPELLNHLDAGSALELPAFRDRRCDILLAAMGFLRYAAASNGASNTVHWPTGFESEAVEVLWRYRWPGGVRELFDLLTTACQRWQQENAGCSDKKLRRRLIGSDHLWKHLVADALRDPYPPSKLPSLDGEVVQARLRSRAARRAARHPESASKQEVPEAAQELLRHSPHLVSLAKRDGHLPVAKLLQARLGCSETWARTVVGRVLPAARISSSPPPTRPRG